MWERACSRRRWFSLLIRRLTHRLREQARSHICFAFLQGDLDLSHRGCRTRLASGVAPCLAAYR
ncbi:hypothetical protein C7U57_12160 [Pseudomonas sp. R9.37]|nr:hypothetical protein C7U57_12160 [Pseudomonas sp. R9.37]